MSYGIFFDKRFKTEKSVYKKILKKIITISYFRIRAINPPVWNVVQETKFAIANNELNIIKEKTWYCPNGEKKEWMIFLVTFSIKGKSNSSEALEKYY